MASIIHTFLVCGTLLVVATLVLLSMPQSQLRFFLLEVLGWAGTVLAGLYILCPVDFIPDFIPFLDGSTTASPCSAASPPSSPRCRPAATAGSGWPAGRTTPTP